MSAGITLSVPSFYTPALLFPILMTVTARHASCRSYYFYCHYHHFLVSSGAHFTRFLRCPGTEGERGKGYVGPSSFMHAIPVTLTAAVPLNSFAPPALSSSSPPPLLQPFAGSFTSHVSPDKQ